MKTKKILARLKSFMNADRRAQAAQSGAIKELLGKLKQKERELKQKLEHTTDDKERDKLAVKLAVCHAQRKKGLAILKEIKASN